MFPLPGSVCPFFSFNWEAHATMDELGCCCTPGAEGCDSQVDVGSQAGVSLKASHFCTPMPSSTFLLLKFWRILHPAGGHLWTEQKQRLLGCRRVSSVYWWLEQPPWSRLEWPARANSVVGLRRPVLGSALACNLWLPCLNLQCDSV